mgnify:CR=1 FL=1
MRLRYSDDSKPGITRKKSGKSWAYFDASGKRIAGDEEVDRLNRIGLPPAYTDAWFSPHANGHIQAVGWDEKGRKQYRYHPDFRSKRDASKFDLTGEFGAALPKLRKRVAADLRKRAMSKDRAVAAVIRLLDIGHIRVGNEAYTKDNKSFGATTLRKRHARVGAATVKLKFRGKSGKERSCTLNDRSLARFVKACQDLDGQHLFAWVDDEGTAQPVDSTDVNDYIRATTGGDFTAKHFRTWAASVTAFEALADATDDLSLKAMLEPVTERLGNTPTIARKSYVHPWLVDLTKRGQSAFRKRVKRPRDTRWLRSSERGLIAFLSGRAPAKAA